MAVVVAQEEKVRALHHLGYQNVDAVSTFALGVPAAMQTSFMIEGAFDKISSRPGAYQKFQQLLCRCDEIENRVFCGADLADIESIGDITVNRKRVRELADYYKIAQQEIGNLLGVPPNPWDMREWLQGGINVSVMG